MNHITTIEPNSCGTVTVKPTVTAEALEYTPTVAAATAHLYERVSSLYSPEDWEFIAPLIFEINRLKKQKNAVILGHNYMTPDVFHCVSDITGDSLKLAQEAAKSDAKVIVQAGVYFMAETSKILCPDKTVLIPDADAGCSLAESITGADVRLLKEKYPGVPVVTYVNTNADVKAESDICCTSSNAVQVVESLGVDTVIMIPDEYLAQNVANQTNVKIITWKGRCEVHERFSVEDIEQFRRDHPGIIVLAHPECPPEVVAVSDFAGSTSGLINYVAEKKPPKVVMITECSMSDNVAAEHPEVDMIRPCQMCPHMKRISLEKILHALQTMETEVEVDPDMAARAKDSIDRMLAVS